MNWQPSNCFPELCRKRSKEIRLFCEFPINIVPNIGIICLFVVVVKHLKKSAVKIIFFIKGNSSKFSLQCDGGRLLNFELGKTRYWPYLKSNKLSYHLFAWLCQMQSFLNKACHCIIGIVLIFHSACNMFISLIHVFVFIFFLVISVTLSYKLLTLQKHCKFQSANGSRPYKKRNFGHLNSLLMNDIIDLDG